MQIGVPKTSRIDTIVRRCGKHSWRFPDLQEKNVQMTLEKGSLVIGALVELRIVEL